MKFTIGGWKKKNTMDSLINLWKVGVGIKWYKCILVYIIGLPLIIFLTVLEILTIIVLRKSK